MRWQSRTSKVEATRVYPATSSAFLSWVWVEIGLHRIGKPQDIPSISIVSIAFQLHFCIYIPFTTDTFLISRIALVLHSVFQTPT